MKAEFDLYIKEYHKDLDHFLSISGETSTYFAYVTRKFYCLFPRLLKIFRPCEKYLTNVQFDALYAVIAEK